MRSAQVHDTRGVADHIADPALIVTASDDFFLPPATTKGMERFIADLERAEISACGH
jgi:hypothetical protein